jgi:hypothetical protein
MVISYLHDIWLKIKVLKCYMEYMYNVNCMLCKLCLPSRWDSFARTQMVISYLHDIWLKIKVLKCYMEYMYNVNCMLCKLCLPSRWNSFVRIQMAIFYLCVTWNHVQCGLACCVNVFHAWYILEPCLYLLEPTLNYYIRFQKVQACAWWQFCDNLWPCTWNLCMSIHPMCI